jgi:hypothetical protein
MQRYRQLARDQRANEKLRAAHAKEAEKLRAAHEVNQFDNYLELLVSLHKDCGDDWDWPAIAKAGAPPLPPRRNRHESTAAAEMQAYKPGFFEKLFGGAKKRLAVLANAVERGRDADQAEHMAAMREHQAMHALWNARKNLAPRVLAGEVAAYSEALEHAAAFEELAAFRTRIAVAAAESDVVALLCEITGEELVPPEEVKLTAAGKLSTKAMAAGRYWALYQDHVCSCALRIANETFAVLPISRVIVNIGTVQTNTSTGHRELATFLAVHFARQTLAKLNLDKIDPSDSMKNFPHRMKFKKTSGFEPVPPITPEEQWVTT